MNLPLAAYIAAPVVFIGGGIIGLGGVLSTILAAYAVFLIGYLHEQKNK